MLIELNDIFKSFRDGRNADRQVLQGLDLTLPDGDFVAVTGVSGSGKTTLLSVLGTLLRPDSGRYTIDGNDVMSGSDVEIARLRNRSIGFMFQDHRLLSQFTALQNILLPTMATRNKPTDEEQERADCLMSQMGIEALAGQMPETLSGGEKSRVALCRALIMQPKLLLADEPTAQLDMEHAMDVARLLRQVNETQGTTIVMVTHSMDVASVARKKYKLENGRLIETA
ncbi:MAG: ABC transporter ATP-binding protein [Bacteroidaceae bacterium]|nr:ABC transporter ATP-binding protein [Bacteroidaceae bacterium]